MPPPCKTSNREKIAKGLKALLDFPFYIYKIYSRLGLLETKIADLKNSLNKVNNNVESLQYSAGIKTSITDISSYKQTLESIIDNADFFDTFRKVPIIKDTYEHDFPIKEKKYFFDMFFSAGEY